MRYALWLLLGFAALAAGCASLTADRGRVDLAKHHRIFVEQRLNDNQGVDRALVAELKALGYAADSGPLTMMPEDTQLVVTYDAREAWDFHPYIIELNVAVRPARDYNIILAAARYFRPGLTAKSSDQMVHELALKLFPPASKP